MSRINAILATQGLALVFLLVWAGGMSQKAFYENCIDRKIERCIQAVNLTESNHDASTTIDAGVLEELRFYLDNREELIAEMSRRHVALDENKVADFLMKARDDSHYEHDFYASY